jgi:hypothetical protein
MSWFSIRWALLGTEPTEWSMITINSNIELALTMDVVVRGRRDQPSATNSEGSTVTWRDVSRSGYSISQSIDGGFTAEESAYV